jgi:hypothetical protein
VSVRAARHTLWIALLMAPIGGVAQQTVDPVLANFREYRAALERNDLAGAETAAAAALAASEAANGARTAVLALNLANLRLELGSPHDALTPARTAHRLATASADAGIDPVAAALTLGSAELAANDPAGAQRLLDALKAADGNTALETDAYNAAIALGRWGIAGNDYGAARIAWGTAARLAHTTGDAEFARARALSSEGVAIALAGMDGTEASAFSLADARAADAAFSQALQLLRERASEAAPATGLTPIQLTYAETLAWQSAVQAKIQRMDGPGPSSSITFNDPGRCALRVDRGDAQVRYPPEVLDRFGVGVVVVHFGVDASGATTSRAIGAAIPPGALGDGVAAVMGDWRTEKDPSSAPSCRMPSSFFYPVRFVLTER